MRWIREYLRTVFFCHDQVTIELFEPHFFWSNRYAMKTAMIFLALLTQSGYATESNYAFHSLPIGTRITFKNKITIDAYSNFSNLGTSLNYIDDTKTEYISTNCQLRFGKTPYARTIKSNSPWIVKSSVLNGLRIQSTISNTVMDLFCISTSKLWNRSDRKWEVETYSPDLPMLREDFSSVFVVRLPRAREI